MLGAVFATVVALAVWWLLPTAPVAAAPDVDETHDHPPVPQSRVELPQSASAFSGDAGAWNLEVVNAVGGTPLAATSVVVGRALKVIFHHHNPPRFRGETDGNGRVLVVPPPGDGVEALEVTVARPFFRPYRGEFVAGMRVVLEPLPPWRGRVLTSSGAPAPGARVLGADEDDAETVSEADGSFVLALPWEGLVLASRGDELAIASAIDGEPLELRLGVPEQRTGVVLGRDERPLPGVTVTANVRALSWTQTTGDDGVFHMPKLDGLEPRLRFEKPGYEPERCEFREEVVLSRPSRLEGTLVDQRGRPLPGVEVAIGTMVASYFMSDETTTTDDVGHFAFDALTAAEVMLQATPDEAIPEDERARLTVTLPEGVTTRVTLAMPPKRDEVTVEYRSIADVEVEDCQTLAAPVPPAGWSSSTNDDATLLLTRGRFHFEVRCDDGRTADEIREVDPRDEAPLRFVVRQPDGGVPFRDELPPDKVRVRVVTASGEAVAGATIECGYRARAETDGEGRAICEVREDDAAWPLVVRAMKGDVSGMVRTAGKDEAVIVLRPLVTLRGRVEGPLPAGNWSVVVRSTAETTEVPLVGTSFALEDRPAIRTFVCIEDQTTLGCALSEAGEPVVIRVGPPGKVTFSAIDAAGAPITELIIYVDRVGRSGVTASDGVVQLELPPGEHVLVLNVADSRARVEVRLTVKPGEVTALGALKLE